MRWMLQILKNYEHDTNLPLELKMRPVKLMMSLFNDTNVTESFFNGFYSIVAQ